MLAFILIFFEKYSFSDKSFEFAAAQSVLFPTEMAGTALLVLVIIIIERYANRSDTKKIEEDGRLGGEDEKTKKRSFFSNDEMFKRTSTARSMTVKLKTVKTTDLDMSSGAAQDFLSSFDANDDDNDVEDSRTKITHQQKTKFVLHWVMIFGVHFYCFWLVPIKSNYLLYGQAACDYSQKDFYGCYNFKENPALRILYILCVFYLIASSFQIAYGFPTIKKASSTLQYPNDLGVLLSNVYYAVPMVVEIRCLLDWIFSKTALDIFQFWQLYNYHFELFQGWAGNKWYTIKPMGIEAECLDKFIFGFLFSSIILFLLIGPFYLFSTMSMYVAYNPVLEGSFELNF